jgi:flagellar secretion chaperone FliS
MNPYKLQSQKQHVAGLSRIDLLLALYDGALTRLIKAEMALSNGDIPVATPYLSKAQLIVSELAAGVRVEVDEEMGTNMLRLYEFIVNELRTPKLKNVENAKRVLSILREGFVAIQDEANELERSGQLVNVDRLHMLLETA